MIDQHPRRACLPDFVMQDAAARQVVEIQHHDTLSFSDGCLAGLGILLEHQEIRCTGHPMEKVREIVGDHHLHLFVEVSQELRHGQNRANGIAVRIDVARQHEASMRLNYSIKAFEKKVSLHILHKNLQRYTFFRFDTYLINRNSYLGKNSSKVWSEYTMIILCKSRPSMVRTGSACVSASID